jgi:hypothetical protein
MFTEWYKAKSPVTYYTTHIRYLTYKITYHPEGSFATIRNMAGAGDYIIKEEIPVTEDTSILDTLTQVQKWAIPHILKEFEALLKSSKAELLMQGR